MVVSLDLPDNLYNHAVKSGNISAFFIKWVEYGLKSYTDKSKGGKIGGKIGGPIGGKIGGSNSKGKTSPAKKAASKANGSAPVKPGSRPRGRPRKADQSGLPADQSGLAFPAPEADNKICKN